MTFKATSVPTQSFLSKAEIRQRYLKYQLLKPAFRHLIKLRGYKQKEYVMLCRANSIFFVCSAREITSKQIKKLN